MSSLSPLNIGEDVSGFQYTEQSKTKVKKKLVSYATVLFILVVLAVIAALADTQVSEHVLYLKLQTPSNISRIKPTATNDEESPQKRIDLFDMVGLALKAFITILTIATIITLYCYYRAIFMLKILRNLYPRTMSFLHATPLLKKFMIEVFLCLLHVPPLTTKCTGISPKTQIVVFIRIYLIGRFLRQKHELMNSQSTRFLASVTKTELSSMFLFKTFFMQYPFQMIFLGYTILLFIGGYGLWLIEDRYTYLDTLWMLVITMTTVGFGDKTPNTFLGRVAVGFASMIGIFLMALFISLVNEALMLKRREKRILAYVENQDNIRRRKTIALNAIGMWYQYYSYIKKHHNYKDITSEYLMGISSNHWRLTKSAIVFRFKAKVLELRMFKAINLWRKAKEAQDNQFFAQEFMIDDIKMLITDMDRKVDLLLEKMPPDDDVSGGSNSKRSLRGSVCSKASMPPQKQSKENPPYQTPEGERITFQDHKQQQQQQQPQPNTTTFCQKPTGEDIMDYNRRRMLNGIGNMMDNNREQIGLKTLLSRKSEPNSQFSDYHDEIAVAFQLLQNQTNIMNHTLDDIYHKTKQDITDLQNIISSLLLCSDEHLYRQTEPREVIL